MTREEQIRARFLNVFQDYQLDICKDFKSRLELYLSDCTSTAFNIVNVDINIKPHEVTQENMNLVLFKLLELASVVLDEAVADIKKGNHKYTVSVNKN